MPKHPAPPPYPTPQKGARAFYNEIDPFAVAWLRNLVDAGHIAPGVVADRSIRELEPADVTATQAHFFCRHRRLVAHAATGRLAGRSAGLDRQLSMPAVLTGRAQGRIR